MAGEIKVTVAIDVVKSGVPELHIGVALKPRDMAGTHVSHHVQDFTTTPALIDWDSITNAGLVWMRNLDNTNSVYFRYGSGGTDMIDLKPGDVQLVRFKDKGTYGVASAGTPKVEMGLVEA